MQLEGQLGEIEECFILYFSIPCIILSIKQGSSPFTKQLHRPEEIVKSLGVSELGVGWVRATVAEQAGCTSVTVSCTHLSAYFKV